MIGTKLATLAACGFSCILAAAPAGAQIGGNGADGAFTPRTDTTLDTTRNGGVFQFTKIDIPAGVTVHLRGPNPARLLSQGPVVVAGTLEADGREVEPGPGGWRGGLTRLGFGVPGGDGQGPGGGKGASGFLDYVGKPATHAGVYGSALPFDLRGGSGGGGGSFPTASGRGPSGGGGGGTVVILADGAITITGSISTRGGHVDLWRFPPLAHGGPGSGGAVLIRGLDCVRISGRVSAAGGDVRWQGMRIGAHGGDGFVRIDAYRTCRVDLSGATITPAPRVALLPYLTELSPAVRGAVWRPRCAALPGDRIAWWMALRRLDTPFPPFGTIHLDYRPGGGFELIGTFTAPGGIDPMVGLDFLVPDDPRLRGMTFYGQAFNVLHAANGKPRLSNLLTTTVR